MAWRVLCEGVSGEEMAQVAAASLREKERLYDEEVARLKVSSSAIPTNKENTVVFYKKPSKQAVKRVGNG